MTQEINFFEIAQGVAVIGASVSAMMGVYSWRAQLKGARKHEIAEETLVLALETRDKIRYIRNSIDLPGAELTRPIGDDESVSQRFDLDRAFNTAKRFQESSTVFNKLEATGHRAKAILGDDVYGAIENIRSCVVEISIAISQLPAAIQEKELSGFGPISIHSLGPDDGNYARAQREACEKIVYEDHFERDRIMERIDGAIEVLESSCTRVLQSRSVFSHWRYMLISRLKRKRGCS